jgi:hypothetical protein
MRRAAAAKRRCAGRRPRACRRRPLPRRLRWAAGRPGPRAPAPGPPTLVAAKLPVLLLLIVLIAVLLGARGDLPGGRAAWEAGGRPLAPRARAGAGRGALRHACSQTAPRLPRLVHTQAARSHGPLTRPRGRCCCGCCCWGPSSCCRCSSCCACGSVATCDSEARPAGRRQRGSACSHPYGRQCAWRGASRRPHLAGEIAPRRRLPAGGRAAAAAACPGEPPGTAVRAVSAGLPGRAGGSPPRPARPPAFQATAGGRGSTDLGAMLKVAYPVFKCQIWCEPPVWGVVSAGCRDRGA